jgi:hypothetical protein
VLRLALYLCFSPASVVFTVHRTGTNKGNPTV